MIDIPESLKKEIQQLPPKGTPRLRINSLKYMAMRLSELATDPADIRKRDITEIYEEERALMLKDGELINAQFNGEPGSGKSTAMIAEVIKTNKLLGKPTTVHHILANQIIYAQVMRGIQRRVDVCIGVDEYDELGQTGFNATIDQAALNHYSDLHREHYVHKFACAPKDTMDKNAFLIFEVQGMDREKGFTRALLYYKLWMQGAEIQQLLGYVDIDVSEILDMPMYINYYKRKQRRLRLFNEHGIRHERDIFAAKVVLEAYDGLKDYPFRVEKNLAELNIEMAARKHRVMNSILTTDKQAGNVTALLTYREHIRKLKEKIKELKVKVPKNMEQEKVEEAVNLLREELEKLERGLADALFYWRTAMEQEQYYSSRLPEILRGKEEI